MEGVVRVATKSDAASVRALRQAEYAASREFTLLSPSLLAWGPDDESGVVLVAVLADGAIVATMRGRLFASREVFEQSAGLDLLPVELSAPTLFLDRASTQTGVRKQGLNSVLRYHFLRAALVGRYPSVSGWLFSGVARTRTMAEIGYHFTAVNATQPRGYRHMESPDRDYVVAVLSLPRIQPACRRLQELLLDGLERWRWVGPDMPQPDMVS